MFLLDQSSDAPSQPGDIEFNEITCGVFESVHVLETNPEEVVLCVLPSLRSENLSVNIQQKLIEAHCVENGIQVLKIDGTEELSSLVKMLKADGTSCNCEYEEADNLTCTVLSKHGQPEKPDQVQQDTEVQANNVEVSPD